MQDCSKHQIIFLQRLKLLHHSIKYSSTNYLKIFLSFLVFFSQHFSYANAQDDTHNGVELNLIYPESVMAGEPIYIYASVFNGSDSTLVYPTITHPNRTESGYTYRSCIKDCLGQISMEPGEHRLMPAGVFYNSADTLLATELVVDDLKLISLISGTSTLAETTFDSVTIDIQLNDSGDTQAVSNPLLYPIPDRQALLPKDLIETGDQLLLHDPNTGYDWLSPDLTSEMLIADVLGAIAADGDYSDFRIARTSQVEELLLNHIHAAGLPAQPNDLRPSPPIHLHNAINEFVELVSLPKADGSRSDGFGLVADNGLSYNAAPDIHSLLFLTPAREMSCNCPTGGLSWRSIALPEGQELSVGVWLVRGTNIPERPLNKPSLFDGELLIPDVLVDGVHYQAVLRMTDESNLVLILAELIPVAPGANTLHFGGTPARLEIPELELINNDGTRSIIRVSLELVPDTHPPALIATELP